MPKRTILYGLAMAVLLFLLKWFEWKWIILDHSLEIYSGALALLFTGVGVWAALKLARPKVKTVIVEKEVLVHPEPAPPTPFTTDPDQLARLGLSARELEVLQLMAEGLSNQEIAARLFVSLNTVKTHSSNIFTKMDVKRRTQAIEQAKKLKIIG
ncbi:MAG: response regulator transcription factor [Bacteroidetes bacterium]|nr:response regulator transcription factor [Bacteroidota bacterium]